MCLGDWDKAASVMERMAKIFKNQGNISFMNKKISLK